MAFIPYKYDGGKNVSIKLAVSQTVVNGDTLNWTSNYLAVGVADDETDDFVALQDVTTSASQHTEVLCVPAFRSGIQFLVDTSADTAVTDLGVAYELSTKGVLDNAATAAANGFIVEEIVGAAADRKVVGHWR